MKRTDSKCRKKFLEVASVGGLFAVALALALAGLVAIFVVALDVAYHQADAEAEVHLWDAAPVLSTGGP